MLSRRIAHYQVLDALGVGGMGTVYRARVEEDAHGLVAGQTVALKVVHAHLLEQPGVLERFLREAEIGLQVRHENVVRTFDCDCLDIDGQQRHFLVMELVEGVTLKGLLEDLIVVPEELCAHIGCEIAKGLAAIHDAGAVHRDLKPENILITSAHQVKVMDLGVAHLQDQLGRLSRTGSFVGSIEYAAPEQFGVAGGHVDARADLFALGILLYELSTGRHPFRSGSPQETLHRVIAGEFQPAGAVNPDLGPCFEETISTLLARAADDRFASARALKEALEEGEHSSWWRERADVLRTRRRGMGRRPPVARETALYGRKDELSKLRTAYDRAGRGEGQVVLLQGEAGIGKTRLVDEFVRRLREEDVEHHFLFGAYPPGGAATAAGAFSTAYREHFGVDTLEDSLASYLAVTPVLLPAFSALLRGDVRPEGAVGLTQDSLQSVFVHVTTALSKERPIIVLIDDLHFAPEEGRALFTALAAAIGSARVLLVGTSRRGVSPRWVSSTMRLPNATRIVLSRLEREALSGLLTEALNSAPLADDLGDLLSLKSGGIPFLAFEILGGLREAMRITQAPDGVWRATGEIRALSVPSSVVDLVKARMHELKEEERQILDVAACCGWEFDPLLVAEVLGEAPIPILQRFAYIQRHHRLVRAVGHTYAFDHHQIHEAFHTHLMPQLAAEYHAAIGRALEARAEAPVGAGNVTLCEQHLRGTEPGRALPYVAPALDHLEGGYLNDQALRLARMALADPTLFEGPERARLLLRWVRILDRLGRRDEEAQALEEALQLSKASEDVLLQVEVLRAYGGHCRLVGRLDEAAQTFSHAAELAEATDDAITRADLLADLGACRASQGRYQDGRVLLEESLALLADPVDPPSLVRKMGSLAGMLHALGEVAEAERLFAKHLALSLENGLLQDVVLARGNLGQVLAGRGRIEPARREYLEALSMARKIGDRVGEAYLHGSLGTLAYSQGQVEESRREQERALALFREVRSVVGEAMARGNLGNLCYALGEFEAALGHYDRTLELSREAGDEFVEMLCLNAQGQVDGWLGEPGRARERLGQALRIARALKVPAGEGEVLVSLASLELSRGEDESAATHVEEALRLLEKVGRSEEASDAYLVRGRLRQRRSDLDGASEDFLEAQSLAASIGHPANTLRAHAPEVQRAPMIEEVPLLRAVLAAGREENRGWGG